MIKSLNLESYIYSKDPGNFFDEIITVDPVASLQDLEYFDNGGSLKFHEIDGKHFMIEGAHELAMFRGKNSKSGFALAQLYLIFRLLTGRHLRKVSLVYSDDALYNGLLGFIVSRFFRVPFVIGIWGNPNRIRKISGKPSMPRLFKDAVSEAKFEEFFLRKADAIQVQNRENGNYPLSLGINPKMISYLPLGIGIADFHFVEPGLRDFGFCQYGLVQERFNIVCISRLEDLKHVDHVIRSLFELRDHSIKFQLHIIGAGSKEEQLAALASEMGFRENVIFHGIKPQEWIACFLTRMDVAVAPLTGRALLEMGLAAVPVIAYDVDWHNEIVVDGETGKLVKYLDYNALGKTILDFHQMGSENLKIMGTKIREKSINLCEPQQIKERQNIFYRRLSN